MSSGRINNKRIERVKESYKIKELVNQENENIQLKKHLKKNSHYQLNGLDDNFDIIKCLHLLLSNCSNLTKKQKFEFCNSQRYFMKLYLEEILRKI